MSKNSFYLRRGLLSAASVIVMMTSTQVTAQTTTSYDFDISAKPLGAAINQLSQDADLVIFADSELLEGKFAPSVRGNLTVEDALHKILSSSDLDFNLRADGTYVVVRKNNLQSIGYATDAEYKENFAVYVEDENRGEANTNLFEEVVVTAQKREQSAMDIPIAISAVTGDTLESLGITDLNALQSIVPGLTLLSTEPGNNFISMRGIGALGGGLESLAPVGYYVDETPVSVATGSMPELALWDLERVEVLRGPQGTLFGDGSMAGTIRVISNKPDATTLEGRASASISTIKGGGEVYTGRGLLNIPLVEDKLAVRAMISYRDFGGWVDNPELGLTDANTHDLFDTRIALRWNVTEDLTADYSFTLSPFGRPAT